MAIVYRHRNPETLDVFYIGVGQLQSRAYSNSSRSKSWKEYVEKYGSPVVDVIANNLDRNCAYELEEFLISEYGRVCDGSGCLVNIHKGGGSSKDTWDKISKTLKGNKLSMETRGKISEATKGRVPWNKGKKRSEETRAKISETKRSQNNKMSKEFCDNVSKRMKGRVVSKETRKKMSDAAIRREYLKKQIQK